VKRRDGWRTSGLPPRLAPPPRRVPLSLRVRILFGGLGLFAFPFLAIGGTLASLFLREADLTSWVRFRGDVAAVQGVSTGCGRTGASENRVPVFENRYAFEVDGERRTGASFATGTCLRPGARVTVEVPAGRPDVSRIAGMRRATFGPGILFVAIFPAVGLAMVLGWWGYVRRHLRLLSRGRVAMASLVGEEETRVTVNGRPVMRMRFAFDTERGVRQEAVVKTPFAAALKDDPRELVLYDPARPERVIAWDVIEGAPRVDAAGQLLPTGTFLQLASVLAAPLGAVLGPALVLYLR